MPPLLHGQAEARGHGWPRRALRAPLRQARRQEEELTDLPPAEAGTERRGALFGAKLKALIEAHWQDATSDVELSGFPGGAGARRGTEGWVLAQERAAGALGPALLWARREHVERLHLLADAPDAGPLARRAAAFAAPPTVWQVRGRDVEVADPAPPLEPPSFDDDVLAFVDVIEAAGADAVVEYDTLLAEVLGLEVGRVVKRPEGARLEIGVGKHDRWAQFELNGDTAVLERLSGAAAFVRTLRRPGGHHPFAQLAPERWLRRVVLARPDLVGAARLAAAPTPVARENLRERAPAVAVGERKNGSQLVVVCSTGIDPDLVAVAADARLTVGADVPLVIAIPQGDDHWVTRELAAALRDPADVVTVQGDWRSLYSP